MDASCLTGFRGLIPITVKKFDQNFKPELPATGSGAWKGAPLPGKRAAHVKD